MEAGGASAGVWRLFVAIPVPEAVQDEMEKAQRELREGLPKGVVRWTKREQFHLTLKFLGNVAEARVANLVEALHSACAVFPALSLRAERVDFFPNSRFPRVVWVGVGDEKEMLARLQGAIENAVRSFTEERAEKRFAGHVTLGRIPRIRRSDAEILANFARGMANRVFGEWPASEVELLRSELSSTGSRYTTLAAIPLSGTT